MNNSRWSKQGFFQPGGTLHPDSPSYIVREADEAFWRWVKSGEYCNLLTARQMGKSSLIVRTQKQLQGEGVRSAVVDLTTIGTTHVTPDQWYLSLVSEIRRKLGLDIDEQLWWQERQQISSVQRFTEFLQVVLQKVPGQIVIFIDEIDSTLLLPFTDDFFIAIRALYNERASNLENRRLTFVLAGTARPADLIKDRTRTPYNIGRSVNLDDFTPQSTKRLLPGLEAAHPDQAEAILERVLYWTGGHPYLTQRVCAEVVAVETGERADKLVDRCVDRLFFQEGQIRREACLHQIDTYIRRNDYREWMLEIYRDILSGKKVRDEERSIEKSQLKLSGLVKATPEGYLVIRNRIYERVFGPEWAEMAQKVKDVVKPSPSVGRWRVGVVALAAVALVVSAVLLTQSNWWRQESPPTPELSPSPTQVVVVPPTSTPLPPAETPTPTSMLTPVATSTGTLSPTPSAILTPTDTSTFTPTPSSTHTPVIPTDTPTFTPIPGPTVPEPGSYITALQAAAIFVGPDPDSEVLGYVPVGESVEVLARARSGRWLYVDKENVTGWVWGPYFGWQEEKDWQSLPVFLTPTPTPTPEPLVVSQVTPKPFCTTDKTKMAGLEVFVQGGQGGYAFFWETQQVGATELEPGHFMVSWLWASAPPVGALTVESGDGQRVRWENIYIQEPSCSP